MLTQIYIKALLVDEELADQVWEAWSKGEIDDFVAVWWRAIVVASITPLHVVVRSPNAEED